MIRIADFDSAGMPFLFVGNHKGGRFVFQHVLPEIMLVSFVGMALASIVELGGKYRRLFDGALITSAERAGEGGFELTVVL